MRYFLFIMACPVLLGSCARLMNEPTRKMSIYTSRPAIVVVNKDTITTYRKQTHIRIHRSKEPVTILTITDSFQKSFSISATNSFAYRANILCNYGIGMELEKNEPKRYTYPRRIYITFTDSSAQYQTYPRSNKGDLFLHLSLPHANYFYLKPQNENTKSNIGFWGIAAGLDYYHGRKQFLNASVSGALDFFLPFPAVVDFSGEIETMSSRYFSISNNHKLGRLSLGYGFSYSWNVWDLQYSSRFNAPPPTRTPVTKKMNAWGTLFSTYYQTGRRFNIGLVYRPTFYRPSATPEFHYEHLLSIDLAWKIRLKK